MFFRNKKILAFVFFLCVILFYCESVSAQKIGIKTNVLYDATATINLGVEFAVSENWTLDISGNYNGWNFRENRKWKHFLIQPEARYWLCEKFNGHFFGLHVHGGEFNVGNVCTPFGLFGDCRNERHEGWYYGAGISYGYQWLLGKRWNLELSAGVGYVGADYTAYTAPVCGIRTGTGHHDYFGPTKASISIIYIIR